MGCAEGAEMKRELNYELLQFHIREASEELDDLLRHIEFSMKLPPGVSEGRMNRRRERKLEEGGLKVSLEHAYHHSFELCVEYKDDGARAGGCSVRAARKVSSGV